MQRGRYNLVRRGLGLQTFGPPAAVGREMVGHGRRSREESSPQLLLGELHDGRFVGPGKILGGVEARYGLIWAPRLLEIKLFGFYDAARVFAPGEAVRLTRHGLHASLGAGVGVALMRNTVVVLEGGKGTEGAVVAFSTSWSY